MSCVLKRKARPLNNYKDGQAPHEISSIQTNGVIKDARDDRLVFGLF